ncbi:MAG: hypothetical protein MUF14_03740 [Hyphomonadaceae bacterium]|jgi:hypothetical protein|nr:hypothetical protein [Hyphomonadaceae bacterium]
MAQVLVRDLSPDTVGRLKAQAVARGVPMQVLLKQAVETASRMTVAERLAWLDRKRVAVRRDPDGPTSLEDICAGRASRP